MLSGGPGLVLQHRQDHLLRFLDRVHLDRAPVVDLEAELRRVQLVFADLAFHQLADQGLARDRDLVQSVEAVHHHHVLRAQALQHPHLDADQVDVEHAHQLVLRAGRIGERPEDVEDGAHAELLAHRRGMLHRRVMVGREHEADADGLDRARDLLGREIEVRAERLEHVGAAAARRHRAVAVLRHFRARGGGDEGGRRRDVEGVRAIAARADGVDHVLVVLDRDQRGELAHHLRGGGDLADGFLLHPQADDEAGDLRRRELAAHDLAHDVQHLVVEDLAVLDRALDRFCDADFHSIPPFMAFFPQESFPAWHARAR